MSTRYRLVADNRERSVFNTLELEMKLAAEEGKPIDYELKTLTVGDYAIIENRTERLIAIFERKTLEKDFPASIKDGRYANKEKMIKAREKSNCRLYYLVEGPLNPPPTKKFSYIPYAIIESAIIHLEMRDGFHIIRTENINDTVKRLIRFIYSLHTVNPEDVIKEVKYDTISVDLSIPPTDLTVDGGNSPSATAHDAGALSNQPIVEELALMTVIPFSPLPSATAAKETFPAAMDMLTEKHEKRDIDVLREMWACLRGISITSADIYLRQFTLKELIRGEIKPATIKELKTPNGKLISKSAKSSLTGLANDTAVCERVLAKVPGISQATAKELIAEAKSLAVLLSYSEDAISIMKIGKSKKSLGKIKAERIVKYFSLRFAGVTQ